MLTALTVAAIGCGIGTTMTTLTIFRAMSADPISTHSGQLFVPQIDNWGPERPFDDTPDHLPNQMTYRDAVAMRDLGSAHRQSMTYVTSVVLVPDAQRILPFDAHARAATKDFFAMFHVPFKFGGAWAASDDNSHASIVVISTSLNDRLFGGVNSVGRTVKFADDEYRVVGVLDKWNPVPRFYDLNDNRYGGIEDLLLPFTRAIDRHLPTTGSEDCQSDIPAGWDDHMSSECVWIQYWVELPTESDVSKYKAALQNYASEQTLSGRLHWVAKTALRDEAQWLDYRHVVPDEVRVLVMVSFTFLMVCLINAIGLMLAKFIGNSREIQLRGALGASRRSVFSQCLMEAGMIGVAGALIGLLLTWLGLTGMRALFTEEVVNLTRLHVGDITVLVGLAVVVALAAGIYPAWRVTISRSTGLLKAQ